MEGFFTSIMQNNKLNKNEAAAIKQNNTWRVRSRFLLEGGLEIPVGGRVVVLFMLVYLQINQNFVRREPTSWRDFTYVFVSQLW